MNKYNISKTLYQGEFRTLYLVNTFDDKKFVMKQIEFKNQDQLNSAENEAELLYYLKHEHVVSFIEAFRINMRFYIVMEYCDGGDLKTIIANQKSTGRLFSEICVCNVFEQLCRAVHFIHAKGVIHRDIKPANIFFTTTGIIKLGDFGIAKVLAYELEMAKTMVATPAYAAPEIWEGKQYNNKCDIWGLGCILYELASLEPIWPYPRFGPTSTYATIPNSFSRQLIVLGGSLLQTDPDARPSANQVLNEIRRIRSESLNHGIPNVVGVALPPQNPALQCSFEILPGLSGRPQNFDGSVMGPRKSRNSRLY